MHCTHGTSFEKFFFFSFFKILRLLAELQRSKGLPSKAPYSYRKEKETHELIFSWLSASGIARGYVRMTATATVTAMVTESHNMAAILQIIG